MEDRLRQNQPIGHDDGDIGVEGRELCLSLCGPERPGMAHLDPEGLGAALDGRGAVLLAAAGGAGWLGVDGGDLVPGRDQRVQRRDRELGRAHEDQSHRASFFHFFSSISRRVRLSRSKYILPFR